jgi:Tetratricopeptide repeat
MSVNNTEIENRSLTYFFTAIGLLTALICFIGGFLPYPGTWGFHQLAFLPLVFKIVIPLLMLIFTVPRCQAYIVGRLNSINDKMTGKSKTYKLLIVFFLIAGAVLLLWSLRQMFFLLGDGNLIIRIIDSQHLGNIDVLVFKNEPLAGYILIVLSKLFADFIPSPTGESPIQMAVILIAALCLFITWQLVRVIVQNGTERILLYGSIVLSGTLQILFGYIEAYIPLYFGIILFITFSLRYIKGTSPLILAASSFGILFCLHFGTLIFFPTLCLLFLQDYRTCKGKNIPAAVLSMLLVSVLILWLLGYPLQKFIALFRESADHVLINNSSATGDHGLFSIYHVINIINLLVLMGIFYIGSFLLMIKFKSSEKSESTEILFLLIFGIMALLFIILFRTEIGTSRDWDILAVFYLGIIIAAGTFAVKYINDTIIRRRLMVMIVGIMALQSFSFVLVNSDEVYARNRVEVLPDRKLWPKSGMLSTYEELSIYYRGLKEPRPALKYLSLLQDVDSSNPRIYRSISHIYSLLNDNKNAIEYLIRALRLSPYDWEIYLELGKSYGRSGQHERAVFFLDKALSLQPKSAEINYFLGIATVNLTKDCSRAVEFFRRSLELDPMYTDAYAGLAFCAAKQNDMVSAREYKQNFLRSKPKNDPTPETIEMLNRIR